MPPSAPPDASGAGTSDASDVLSPNLPYDVAAEPLSGDGASRRGAGGGGARVEWDGTENLEDTIVYHRILFNRICGFSCNKLPPSQLIFRA